VASVGKQSIAFVGLLILARILYPEDYGSAALVLLITNFAAVLTDFGIGAAVVSRRSLTESYLRNAFWLNVSVSVGVGAVIVVCARPIASLLGDVSLSDLVVFSGVGIALSIGATHLAWLERSFRFRRIAIVELFAALVSQGVAVSAAVAGLGAASLVLSAAVNSGITSALLVLAVLWFPRFAVQPREVVKIWRFSRWLLLFNFVNYWSRNADNLVVGRLVSLDALGYYSRAYSVMMLPLQQVSTVIGRVLLPALAASVQNGAGNLWETWVRTAKACLILGLPVAAWFFACSGCLVDVVLGQRWVGGVSAPLAFLSLSIPPQLITRTSGALFQAAGRPRRQFGVGIINTCITLFGILVGLATGGMLGVAIGVCISFWLSLVVVLMSAASLLQSSVSDVVLDWVRPLACGIVSCGIGWLASKMMEGQVSLFCVAVSACACLISFAVLLFIVDRRGFLLVLRMWNLGGGRRTA
jgi:PST family polysaccharide transporter